MDTLETIRSGNVILGTILFAYCMMRLMRDWPVWSRRERAVRTHLIGYIFVSTVGTFLILWNTAPETRAYLLFAVNVSLALSLWRNRRDPVDSRSAADCRSSDATGR